MSKLEKGSKRFWIYKLLILLAIICAAFAVSLIWLGLDKAKISTFTKTGNQIKENYASTENNIWDISENEDGSVVATLDENGLLTISGQGKMRDWEFFQTPWYSVRNQINSVEFSGTVTSIGDRAFEFCESLTKIEIPSSVTSIGDDAFRDCTSLTDINIPSSVTSIGIYAFYNCTSLTSIEVEENNTVYKDENGVLYSKDGTKIIIYPAGKTEREYKILDGVTSIGEFAFSYCKSLTSIIVPSNVMNIGVDAFYNSSKLTIICKSGSVAEKYSKENSINYIIDDEVPTITSITENSTSWTNQNVILTIKAEDSLSGLAEKPYSFDGGVTWQKENTKIYTENTNGIIIKVKDKLDNIYTHETISITKIDRQAPSIILTTDTEIDAIIVVAVATDSVSGIDEKSYKYYIKEENSTYEEPVKDGVKHTFTGLKNSTKYCIKVDVADKAGNIASKEIEVTTNVCKITSTILTVDEEKLIIKGIKPKTTVGKIKQNLQSEATYQILDVEGNIATDEAIIGTDYKVRMEDGKEYTIIVFGDFTGDGKISVAELARTSRIAVQTGEPTLKEQMIIDVNMDNKIAVSDLAAISRFAIQ